MLSICKKEQQCSRIQNQNCSYSVDDNTLWPTRLRDTIVPVRHKTLHQEHFYHAAVTKALVRDLIVVDGSLPTAKKAPIQRSRKVVLWFHRNHFCSVGEPSHKHGNGRTTLYLKRITSDTGKDMSKQKDPSYFVNSHQNNFGQQTSTWTLSSPIKFLKSGGKAKWTDVVQVTNQFDTREESEEECGDGAGRTSQDADSRLLVLHHLVQVTVQHRQVRDGRAQICNWCCLKIKKAKLWTATLQEHCRCKERKQSGNQPLNVWLNVPLFTTCWLESTPWVVKKPLVTNNLDTGSEWHSSSGDDGSRFENSWDWHSSQA